MTSQPELGASYIAADTLFHFDESGKTIPWLATDYKYSADMKTVTLSLRKGVIFQDNTPFNAAAVKTNLDLCIAAKRGELASVSSVEVVDDSTVKLNLSKVDAYIIPNLGEYVGIMISPAALAKGKEWCTTNVVGTGPFKLVDYQAGVSASYTKWDGYWQQGKPYLDGVKLVVIPTDMTALTALKAGEINMMYSGDTTLTKGMEGSVQIVSFPMFLSLSFDTGHPDSPFSDIKARQALAYAIDSNALANTFGPGYWKANNQFSDKSWAYYDPTIVGYPFNIQKAKDVLATSKYPNGFTADLNYGVSSANTDLCTAVQAMAAKAGITLNLKSMSMAAAAAARNTGWQNGALLENQNTVVEKDPGRVFQTSIAPNSGRYPGIAYSAAYTDLINKVTTETDFTKRAVLDQQMVKQIIDGDCMMVMLAQGAMVTMKTKNLHDDHRGSPWMVQWAPENAWLSK